MWIACFSVGILVIFSAAFELDLLSGRQGDANSEGGGADAPAEYFDAVAFRRGRRAMRGLAEDCSVLPDPCQPNGNCMQDIGCVCYLDAVHGYWRDALCTSCAYGYAGLDCTISCQGGSCNPCSSNGVCNQGTSGDGSCSCFSDTVRGFWFGQNCSECAPNYFGTQCNIICPGLLSSSAVACFGHGYCGRDTGGKCLCETGFGNQSNCFDCDNAHFGSACSSTCNGFVSAGALVGAPCSGHGMCFSGNDGNGTCICDPGWATQNCSVQCPGNGICSGNGTCSDTIDGTGRCTCTEGRFALPDCATCIANFTGASCEIDCLPLINPSTNEICSGHGRCTPFDGFTAMCDCVEGYNGTRCEISCGGVPSCSGHGICDLGTTQCMCLGGWSGAVCDVCSQIYNGSLACDQACPVSNGLVCSGNGICRAGHCYCNRLQSSGTADYCGLDCSVMKPYLQGQTSGCNYCTSGPSDGYIYSGQFQFGSSCSSLCPGTGPQDAPFLGSFYTFTCSGHGYCDEGKNATGACACVNGYAGTDCSHKCPVDPVSGDVCAGFSRGTCQYNASSSSAYCSCRSLFTGQSCNISCPSYRGVACNGHGSCNFTGSCNCDSGWTGVACSVPCYCNAAHGKCDIQQCNSLPGFQVCTSCICDANFTGLCNDCIPGSQGLSCEGPCLNGRTEAQQCMCFGNYSTASCAVPCPMDTNGNICSNNGICPWGNAKSGQCECFPDYYGATCASFCSVANCSSLLNAQCNKDTGACECQSDDNGHWRLNPATKLVCDTCAVGYWGPTCADLCECNKHGSCDQNSGECQCYSDPTNGFYAGSTCATCASGYIGVNCQSSNVLITKVLRNVTSFVTGNTISAPPLSPPTNLLGPNSVTSPTTLMVEDKSGLIIAGGIPIWLLNTTTSDLAVLPNTTNQFQNFSCMRSGACCANAEPDTVHTWNDQQYLYFLLQPYVSGTCNLSLRIVRAPMLRGNTTTWSIAEVITDFPTDLLVDSTLCSYQPFRRMDLRIFHATAQSDRGYAGPSSRYGQSIPDNIVAFTVSSPRTDSNVSVDPLSGGYVVVINLRNGYVQQRQLNGSFTAWNVAMSPFRASGASQVLVVAGDDSSLTSPDQWEMLNFTLDAGSRTCLLGNAAYPSRTILPSIRPLVPCWPNPGNLTTCPLCLSARQVHFRGWAIVVAFATPTDTLLAWVQPLSDVTSGTTVVASVGGVCTSIRDGFVADQPLRNFFVLLAPADAGGYAYATAMAFDAFASITYAALAIPGSASQVIKYQVQPSAFGVLGVLKLSYVSVNGTAAAIPEVVSRLVVSNASRTLYGLITGIRRLRLNTFLLYEVQNIVPNIASFAANTLITVYGNGFQQLSSVGSQQFRPVCNFGGSYSTPATIVSPTVLTCFAAGVSDSVDKCAGQTLEVSLFGSRWPTQNLRTLNRQPAPLVSSPVNPPRWIFTSRTITISGSAFVTTAFGTCRFFYCNTTGCTYANAVTSPVTTISSSVMTCVQPTVTSTDYNALDVSFDGTQFSNVTLNYTIVGPPTNISVSESSFVLAATNFTTLSFVVYTVDERHNQLLNLDRKSYEVYVVSADQQPCNPHDYLWRSEGDGFPDPCRNVTFLNQSLGSTELAVNSWASAFPQWASPSMSSVYAAGTGQQRALGFRNMSVEGAAEFNSLMMYRPRLITNLPLRVRALATDWSATIFVTIIPGNPFALMINDIAGLSASIEIATETGAVSPSINVYAVDEQGNKCVQTQATVSAFGYYVIDGSSCLQSNQSAAQACFAQGQYHTESLTIASVASSIGVFTFSASLDYKHGVSHYILFSSPGLKSTTSPQIRTKNCGPQLYKLANTTQCLPCPSTGAVCDGTELVTVVPGYWRGDGARTVVYPCPLGASTCLGSIHPEGSDCAANAVGPLCSQCKTGFGHGSSGQCTSCQSESTTIIYAVLIALAITLVLLVWSFATLRTDRVTDFSVVFRTLVNHMQASGQLGQFSAQFQPLVQQLFRIQSGASSFSVDGFQTFDCLLAIAGGSSSSVPPYVYLFASYMALPVLAAVIAFLQYGAVRVGQVVPLYSADLNQEIQNDIEHFGEGCASAKWKRTYPLFMVLTSTFNVCMFTLYQTLITQSTRVLQCTDFVVAQAGETNVIQGYMKVDMSVLCQSNNKNILTTPALFFGILYGFGIPIVFVFGYKFVNVRAGKPALTDFIFLFLCGGYKPQFWYWQATIMVRKMILVLIIVFLSNENQGELQSYCGMWVMSAALVLQLWLQPAEKKEHNDVEALSLSIITLTLNLSLTYFWPGLPNWSSVTITILLFAFNILAMLMLLRFIYMPLVELGKDLVLLLRELLETVKIQFEQLTGKREKKRTFKVQRSNTRRPGRAEDDEGEPYQAVQPKFFQPVNAGLDRDDVFCDFDELDAMHMQLKSATTAQR